MKTITELGNANYHGDEGHDTQHVLDNLCRLIESEHIKVKHDGNKLVLNCDSYTICLEVKSIVDDFINSLKAENKAIKPSRK